MSSIDSAALAGLRAASDRIAIRAQNIANQQTEGYRPAVPVQSQSGAGAVVRARRLPPESAQQRLAGTNLVLPQSDLATELTDVLVSRTAYKVSATLLKTGRALDQALLDILS